MKNKTDTLAEVHPELLNNLELLKGQLACIELARKELSIPGHVSDMNLMRTIRIAYPDNDPVADNATMTARIEADYRAIKSAVIGGRIELAQRLHRAAGIQ